MKGVCAVLKMPRLGSKKSLFNVEPLPPWHPARERIELREIPAYLKKLYNVSTNMAEVKRWAVEGVDHPSVPGKTVYLKLHRFAQHLMVHKADLIEFCEIR